MGSPYRVGIGVWCGVASAQEAVCAARNLGSFGLKTALFQVPVPSKLSAYVLESKAFFDFFGLFQVNLSKLSWETFRGPFLGRPPATPSLIFFSYLEQLEQ